MIDTSDRVERTIARFAAQLRRQDASGQAKHGGELDRKPTFEHLGMELIDAWNYYDNERIHRDEAVIALRECLGTWAPSGSPSKWCRGYVVAALNLLTIGNVEGVPEEENEECPF